MTEGFFSRGFMGRRREQDTKLPPGQYLVDDFPVLSAGPTPRTPLSEWDFSIIGEVDGFAAIRTLASHEATGATTVIATSLAITPEIVRAAKGSGAAEVLQRPLRARSLGRLLRNLRRGR